MRRRHIVVSAVAFVLFFVWVLALSEYAGITDPTNPPGSTSSYTLEDIYNRLNEGTDGSQSTFTEPAAGPGTPTMHTLNDIMEVAPVADNTNSATTSDVRVGKEFWGLNVNAGEWGPQTGTLSVGGSVCIGTMYSDGVNFFGTRWCDQVNGTVLDMTTGLVWLKDAECMGYMDWNAAIRDPIVNLRNGDCSGNLADGSVLGDWRLPTKDELDGITEGDEYILSGRPGPFDNVQSVYYWSSNSFAVTTDFAWVMIMDVGHVYYDFKRNDHYVWPVRAGQ